MLTYHRSERTKVLPVMLQVQQEEQKGELRLQLQQGMQVRERDYQQDLDSKDNLTLFNLPHSLQGITLVSMILEMIQ